jgi:DNA-binding NarL/FixJ family response regulator
MTTPRILVVEDEPLVALELTETLRDAGFDVPEAIDSADLLLSSVRAHHPDLVVMDVRLKSFIDGIDAVTRLRFVSETPVIYLTAYSTPDVIRRAEGTQPAAFLAKPIDGPVLVSAIRSALSLPPTAV